MVWCEAKCISIVQPYSWDKELRQSSLTRSANSVPRLSLEWLAGFGPTVRPGRGRCSRLQHANARSHRADYGSCTTEGLSPALSYHTTSPSGSFHNLSLQSFAVQRERVFLNSFEEDARLALFILIPLV